MSFDGPLEFKDGVTGYVSSSGLMENVTIEGPLKENLVFKVVF